MTKHFILCGLNKQQKHIEITVDVDMSNPDKARHVDCLQKTATQNYWKSRLVGFDLDRVVSIRPIHGVSLS